MVYTVTNNYLASGNPMRYATSVEGEFGTYEVAVAFCKQQLDALAHTVNTWQDQNPMWKEYEPNDAFQNGDGNLKITPGPQSGPAFSASDYFYSLV